MITTKSITQVPQSTLQHFACMHSLSRDELFIVYQWIKHTRQKHGLTQEALAEELGVDPRTIRRWEKGGTEPQLRHCLNLQRIRESRKIGILDDYRDFGLLVELSLKRSGHTAQAYQT